MNSEGVVLEYSSEPFHKSDEIIAGINAHYGTSFYQEDDIDKDFTIGETMPNWNAYEKIEMPQIKYVKYFISNTNTYMAAHIDYDNMKLKIWSTSGQAAIVQFDSAGKWVAAGGDPRWNTDFLNAVIAEGINVESAELEDIPNMQQGGTIQNWSEYVEV